MIAVTLEKSNANGKQMVTGWFYISKERSITLPQIPGKRVYVDENKVPVSFYKDCSIHCYDNGILVPIYSEKIGTSILGK